MHRWKELVAEEMDRQIADDGATLDQYHQFVHSRVVMAVNIDLDVVSGDKAVDMYLADALKAHFGGVDIQDGRVVTPAFEAKQKDTVANMVNYLKGLVKAGIDR